MSKKAKDETFSVFFWKKRIPLLASALLCASAFAYLFRPPWFDEILTLQWLKFPLMEIPFQYAIPNNHIVYTMALSIWKSILEFFDLFELIPMRLLSVVCGCAAIWILAKDLVRHCGCRAGGTAIMLFATSGTVAIFSTAFRGYIFALLFCVLSFRYGCLWMRKNRKSDFIWFALFTFLGAGVMPTDLFLMEAPAILMLPELFKKRDSLRETGGIRIRYFTLLFTPPVLLLAFYFPILPQLYRVSRLAEGWYTWEETYWNLYGTFLVIFLPALFFAAAGTVELWKSRLIPRWSIVCAGLVFLLPAGLAPIAKVPPFPRVFFPLFGVWTLLTGFGLAFYFRKRGRFLPVFLLTAVWIALLPFIQERVSDLMFRSGPHDDLTLPYYARDDFRPLDTVKTIARNLPEDGFIFVDFAADPPSIGFQLYSAGIPDSKLLYDRPDRPKPDELGDSDLIVCSPESDLKALRERFKLSGEYERIGKENTYHSIFRKKSALRNSGSEL